MPGIRRVRAADKPVRIINQVTALGENFKEIKIRVR
jgi:hypothetical protein